MTKINWAGFSKKSLPERLAKLETENLLSEASLQMLRDNEQLPLQVADQMVENLLATFSLPFSLVPDVLVDGKNYQVPYVTEEPSVVAAAAYANKLIKRSGGFKTTVHNRLMIGQVSLYAIDNMAKAKELILQQKTHLLDLANQAYPSIVKRGGGARDLWVELLDNEKPLLNVYLTVDSQEAMGANMVNTMAEALKAPLEELSGGQTLMAILSNYASESLVTASCSLDLRFLSRNKEQAQHLAEKMVLASQLAQLDPYRAATHNKGIFNGIDALVLATGNDWRAIEAGCHAYASRQGNYQGLSTWTYDQNKQKLIGQMTLPMPIATKGGSIGLNPTVQLAFDLLGKPKAKELASLLVSIGLAQNFAALKALVSTGIQSGHMKLQAKSLALQAGAREDEVKELTQRLHKAEQVNLVTAQAILEEMRQN